MWQTSICQTQFMDSGWRVGRLDFGVVLSLAGLALIDSTSYGTLVVPLVLIVLQRQVNPRQLGWYFLTVVVFYLVIGFLLLLGLDAIFDVASDILNSRVGSWTQLVIGVGLFALSFRIGKKPRTRRTPESRMPKTDSARAMIGLGLTATILELATMLPYLSAIGLLEASDLAIGSQIVVLAGYCLVMIVPALIIIGLAMAFGERSWPRLERLNAWVLKNSEGTLAWIVGIAGFLIASDAFSRLNPG